MNDRELDAAVAQEVMGFILRRHPLGTRCGHRSTAKTGWGDATTWACLHDPDDKPLDGLDPRYSTDGNAMLEVCDKLKDEWVIGICLLGDGRWLVWIEHGIHDTQRLIERNADTLPRAVAEAALAAVRSRQEATK